MDKQALRALLEGVRDGSVTPEAAMTKLRVAPFEDLGYARVDHHRGIRQGANEVIFGLNKTPAQILGIAKSMLDAGCRDILVTRISLETAQAVCAEVNMVYHAEARLGVIAPTPDKPLHGHIVVAAGGTSDLPVAEEAALTAQTLGSRVTRLYDVGVSGLHRLLPHVDTLCEARAVVAVAGMEGALASVVGGLVDCPVIAVPTSVGYGASFGGVAALLAMLNSCASGVSVVNIDNGFGAGYLAHTINRMESAE